MHWLVVALFCSMETMAQPVHSEKYHQAMNLVKNCRAVACHLKEKMTKPNKNGIYCGRTSEVLGFCEKKEADLERVHELIKGLTDKEIADIKNQYELAKKDLADLKLAMTKVKRPRWGGKTLRKRRSRKTLRMRTR